MSIELQLLKVLPLFAALPDPELRLLADQLSPVPFDDGALIVREGEACQEFYIILSGQVDIVKALATPDQRLLAVRPAGTVVGELSLFSPGGQHTASVMARGPVETLAMTSAGFNGLLSSEPRLAYSMVQTLSLRLIEAEQTTIRELRAKNDALSNALLALQAAQAQVVEKEKLERELEVARDIQCSLLCNEPPQIAGYQIGTLIEAMSAVGGDFYDFIEFPDGRLGIAIGDVSDHGVPAALFGAMTMTLLRTAARRGADHGVADPAEVLREVNRGLLEFDRSSMFVTVLYGVLDPQRAEFTYARAGHEPPLLHLGPAAAPAGPPRGAEETGTWIVDPSAWAASSKPGAGRLPRRGKKGKLLTRDEPPETKDRSRKTNAETSSAAVLHTLPTPPGAGPSALKRGQALGIFPAPVLDEQQLALPARSTLLLYTDGAREAWDPAGNMFGETGLRAALAETEAESAEAVCGQLFRRLAAYRGPLPQQDDITLVVVRTWPSSQPQ